MDDSYKVSTDAIFDGTKVDELAETIEDLAGYESDQVKGYTVFEVEGILITPEDGVYFTSDLNKYLDGDAKGPGSYLYYDSDQNGFYETVYILSPIQNGDGSFDVLELAYLYGGDYDLDPYRHVVKTVVSQDADLSDFARMTQRYHPAYLYHFADLAESDLIFENDKLDAYFPTDQIFPMKDVMSGESYYDKLKEESYMKYHSLYRLNLQKDIWDQVFMMTTGLLIGTAINLAISTASFGAANVIGAIVGGVAFVAVYTLMTKFNSDMKYHQQETQAVVPPPEKKFRKEILFFFNFINYKEFFHNYRLNIYS